MKVFATLAMSLLLARTGWTFTFPNISQPLDLSNIHFQNEDNVTDDLWERHVDTLISRGVVQLALRLDHAMGPPGRSLPEERNVVFSPTSIASALALVLLGSSGRTRQEVANVLGISTSSLDTVHQHFGLLLAKQQVDPSNSSDTYTASAAAVFVQEDFPVKEHFKMMARDTYNSEIISLDFASEGQQAKEMVNNWVFNNTYGLIEGILEDVPSPETRIIIASALYFNGAWKYTFPLHFSSWRPFHVGTGSSDEVLQVIMMKTTGEEMLYHEDKMLGCRVVGLPYKGGIATMFLVLPDDPGVVALRQFESQLTPRRLQELADSTAKTSVIIALPRMRLESTIQLRSILKSLGVEALFDPSLADLSELADFNITAPLYADDVIHKVVVDVTETGTVASASTAVSLTRDGSHKVVQFNRPFLFFIRHEPTRMPLFWGSVVRPEPHQSVR